MNNSAERIMIVDDEPANLAVLEGFLSKQGYWLSLFPRADLAFAAAVNDPPDLILLDIRMPGMSGYDFCTQARGISRLADVPIIFISAMDAAEDIVRGLSLGAVDYVTKPFLAEVVTARVRTHLVLHQTRERLIERNCDLAEINVSFRRLDDLHNELNQFVGAHMHPLLQDTLSQLRHAERDISANSPMAMNRVARAIQSAEMLLRMTGDLCDFGQLGTMVGPLERIAIDARSIIQDAVESKTRSLRPKTLRNQVPSEAVPLRCDARLISRVISNLMEVVKRETPGCNAIDLRLSSQESGVQFEVSAESSAPDLLNPERDHERPVRKDGESSYRDEMTGPRLTFCRLAVEAHGGTLVMGVTDPDPSPCFWFVLPS